MDKRQQVSVHTCVSYMLRASVRGGISPNFNIAPNATPQARKRLANKIKACILSHENIKTQQKQSSKYPVHYYHQLSYKHVLLALSTWN